MDAEIKKSLVDIGDSLKKISERTVRASPIPWWVSFVFLCLFVGGCVESCSFEGGFRKCIETVRRAAAVTP